MSAASVRRTRTIIGPGSCPAARCGQGACNVIENFFQEQYAQCGAGQEEPFLKKALLYANRFVFQKAAHEEALAGMGTTAVCALVRSGNVYGTQFHPEKSGDTGLRLLKAFAEL